MSERYQREIEEILGKVNEETSEGESGRPRQAPRGQRRTARPRRPRGPILNFSPGGLFRLGLAFLAAALVVNLLNWSPAGFGVAAPLAYLGVALLVIAYVSYFTRPRRTIERRWRGQVIDDPPEGPLSRLWRWITRG